MKRLVACLVCLPALAWAAPPPNAFQQGLDFANNTLKNTAENAAKTAQPQNVVPNYAGTNVPETGYGNLGSGLTSTAQGAVTTNPAASWFQQSSATRPKFTLDPATDPILTTTQNAVDNSNAMVSAITGTYQGCAPQKNPSATSYTTEFCTEWADTVPLTCQRTLNVTVTQQGSCTPGSVVSSGSASAGNITMEIQILCGSSENTIAGQARLYDPASSCADNGSWQSFTLDPNTSITTYTALPVSLGYESSAGCAAVFLFVENGQCIGNNCSYNFSFIDQAWLLDPNLAANRWSRNISLAFLKPSGTLSFTDAWNDGCATLRQREADGECTLTSPETCIDGPSTRVINGQSVTRDCWVYETGFECLGTTTTEEPYCQELRDRGCYQVGSTCVNAMLDGTCAEYQQEYRCPNGTVGGQIVNCNVETFCIDGACVGTDYQTSQDFGLAAAYLNAAAETAIDFDRTTLGAFKGIVRKCKKTATSFTNCCKTAGWGVDLGVTECTQNEILLSQERQAGKCHYVGNYKKGSLFWTKTYQSFCCFGSKLGRIIQEQARQLLGIGWGSPEKPDCRALTLTELTSIDWSLMDLSEFFSDVIANTSSTLPNPQALEQQLKTNVQNYLNNLGAGTP